MEKYIRVNEKMIFIMDKENNYLLMEVDIKENLSMESNMEKEQCGM